VTTGPQTGRQWLPQLLALSISVLMVLLLLEAGLRLLGFDHRFYDNAGSQWILPEGDVGSVKNPFDLPAGMRTPRPGSESRLAGHPVRINDHGMRANREYAFDQPPGTVRVMMVGDSVTFSNTSATDAPPRALERALEERLEGPVEVPVFSCPAWNLWDYHIAIRKAVSRFEFDHLVVGFVMNDMPKHEIPLDPDARRGDPTRGVGGWTAPIRAVLRHTALGTWVHWRLKGLIAQTVKRDPTLGRLIEPREGLEPRFEWARPVLRSMAEVAASRGAGFTVLVWPYAVQLDPEMGRWVLEEWYGLEFDPRFLDRAPQRALLRLCREEGLHCVDASPPLLAAERLEPLFFAAPDGRIDYIHFSPAGNQLTMDFLADELAARLRPPTAGD